jgi:hypothetical protein
VVFDLIARAGSLMLRLLVCLLLMPAMLLPSGVCICHYFTLTACSTTTTRDHVNLQCSQGDNCPSDIPAHNHSLPCPDNNTNDHPPCGPAIKALVGSFQVQHGNPLTSLCFLGGCLSFEAAVLPDAAAMYPFRRVPADQRHLIYLSLLNLRI